MISLLDGSGFPCKELNDDQFFAICIVDGVDLVMMSVLALVLVSLLMFALALALVPLLGLM